MFSTEYGRLLRPLNLKSDRKNTKFDYVASYKEYYNGPPHVRNPGHTPFNVDVYL